MQTYSSCWGRQDAFPIVLAPRRYNFHFWFIFFNLQFGFFFNIQGCLYIQLHPQQKLIPHVILFYSSIPEGRYYWVQATAPVIFPSSLIVTLWNLLTACLLTPDCYWEHGLLKSGYSGIAWWQDNCITYEYRNSKWSRKFFFQRQCQRKKHSSVVNKLS